MLVTFLATSAHAQTDGGGANAPSDCSKTWLPGTVNGGSGVATMTWSGDTSTSRVHVTNMDAKVWHLVDCFHGTGAKAYKIKVVATLSVSGHGLTSCSAGFPSGISCTASGQNMSYTDSTTCSPNKASCELEWGSSYFYPPNGGKFDDASVQERAWLYDAAGDAYTWTTPRV
jgi:hypothetical protein